MWLHCSLSVVDCRRMTARSTFLSWDEGNMQLTVKTCSTVKTCNIGAKVTDLETLSCKTVWQVEPLIWQHIVCFPHCSRLVKQVSCFHSHKYFFSSYQKKNANSDLKKSTCKVWCFPLHHCQIMGREKIQRSSTTACLKAVAVKIQ